MQYANSTLFLHDCSEEANVPTETKHRTDEGSDHSREYPVISAVTGGPSRSDETGCSVGAGTAKRWTDGDPAHLWR